MYFDNSRYFKISNMIIFDFNNIVYVICVRSKSINCNGTLASIMLMNLIFLTRVGYPCGSIRGALRFSNIKVSLVLMLFRLSNMMVFSFFKVPQV